eukprot:gnl/TRDRNA2_/TRDRNA2_138183_c0_seq1.p1 gnl/TRDRNA2_/TRDRNA2_138183_c0~~gnl/TRDRNA2_/TRDRNA2_138183_c0_seq1.p1  ORF type:complete len:113 (+),score=21.72 gnl/TRDRNA2_/TRDRNA2_138183_c0_seq1:587-925(+)
MERLVDEFQSQNLANTTWAFATVESSNAVLFVAVAKVAESRLWEFGVQDLANLAWASGTAADREEKLFAAMATVADRRVGALSTEELRMMLWALSRHDGFLKDAWSLLDWVL